MSALWETYQKASNPQAPVRVHTEFLLEAFHKTIREEIKLNAERGRNMTNVYRPKDIPREVSLITGVEKMLHQFFPYDHFEIDYICGPETYKITLLEKRGG